MKSIKPRLTKNNVLNVKQFMCKKCSKLFGTIRNLRNHLAKFHGQTIVEYFIENGMDLRKGLDYVTCEICKRKYLQLSLSHIRSHGFKHVDEYLKKFPDSPITATKMKNLISQKSTLQWGSEQARKSMSELKKARYRADPWLVEKIGRKSREYWSSEENRIAMSITKKGFYQQNPNVAKAHSSFLKNYYKKHPAERIRLSEIKKQQYKKNPHLKTKVSKAKKRFYSENPKAREEKAIFFKEFWSNPREKKKMSIKIKEYFDQNPEALALMSKKAKERYVECPELKNKISSSLKEFFRNNPQAREYLSKKIAELIATGKVYPYPNINLESGIYESKIAGRVDYMSSYELKRYIQLDELSSNWTRYHGVKIPYEHPEDGSLRRYVPDIKCIIDGKTYLEEVKPKKFIDNAQNQAKAEAAKKYCKERGWHFRFITEDELFSNNRKAKGILL